MAWDPSSLSDDELDAELRALGVAPDDVGLERLVDEAAGNLEWLSRIRRQYPLACSVLWEAPQAACDQRRMVATALTAPAISIGLGGWRSGKSSGYMQATVAMALGGDHPAVTAWLALNDLPRDAIPPGPAEVYAIAPSSGDSVKYHRRQIDNLVGSLGKTWYNRNAKGEAWLYVEVPNYDAPATIWFKAIDQGRRAFQGISLRWWWVDEEPLGEEGEGVVDELLARVLDQDGRGGISMVPLEGITWVHDRLVEGHEHDCRVTVLDSLDNPHLPRKRFERHFDSMSEDEVAQRRFGQFRSRSGLVYNAWAPGDGDRFGPGHLCEPFDIPADWPRFRGIDFGLSNPTCVLWGALGDDDTLYIYRELYEGGPTYEEHADRVHELEGRRREGDRWVRTERTESIEGSWGDPSASQVIDDWALRDIYVDLANREVKAGIDAVKNRLRLQADNRPRIKVFRTCENLQREFRAYVWDRNRRDEVPVKKDDHALDALRYMVMGIEEWRSL